MSFVDFLNERKIIDKYNIVSAYELSGGLVNKVYKIKTKNQIYVVKVFNDYNIKNINYKEVLIANLIGRFNFLHFNLEITLTEKTGDENDYLRASKEVINMINEINYYLKIIDELCLFLEKI